MTKLFTGYGRGASKQAREAATPQGRAIANLDNPQVKRMAHSTASGIDKAASATRRLAPSSHGGLQSVTDGLPASAKAPRKVG
jgi:hypothetical protein